MVEATWELGLDAWNKGTCISLWFVGTQYGELYESLDHMGSPYKRMLRDARRVSSGPTME